MLVALAGGCSATSTDVRDGPNTPSSPEPAERVLRSTVGILVTVEPDRGPVRGMIGTGVVLSDDGLIVTSNHVATLGGDKPADSITVYDAEGREDEVTVVAQAPDCDLAFLRTTLDGLVPAPMENDLASIQPGTPVFAVGAPQHFEEPIAPGVVVEVLRRVTVTCLDEITVLIGTSADTKPGFSGGPLAITDGRVIGITLATTTHPQTLRRTSLAVPVALVLKSARRLHLALPQAVGWRPLPALLETRFAGSTLL